MPGLLQATEREAAGVRFDGCVRCRRCHRVRLWTKGTPDGHGGYQDMTDPDTDDVTLIEFKTHLTDQERQDFEGAGTRTFGGEELRWRNQEGVHACEATEVVPDVMVAWTLCGIDLPAAAALHIEDEVDCTMCSLRRAGLPDPARPTQPYRARPAARPRVQTIEDHEMRWTLRGEPTWRGR